MSDDLDRESVINIIREKWDAEGMCRSCGYHAALYEYEPLIEWWGPEDAGSDYIELPCLSGESGHRGARIYLNIQRGGES